MGNVSNEIQNAYEIGMLIFTELFKLSDKDLKGKLKSICENKLIGYGAEHLLSEPSHVKRIIENETPSQIVLAYYDVLEIGPFGIHYIPEHGSGVHLVSFDKHFKL